MADRTRPRAELAVIALCAFLMTLDTTVVTVALPAIQRELGMSVAVLEWVSTAYILTFCAFMIAGGRLADRYGPRRVLVAGLGVFTAASLAAALAASGAFLIGARAVQGVGAALVLPATLSVVMAAPGQRERDRGAAVWMVALAAALALGPVVGGVVTQAWHWSGIFLLNLPLGVVAAVLAVRVVRAGPAGSGAESLDVPGLLACATTLAAGTFALIHGQEAGWHAPATVAAGVVAVTAAVTFGFVERRAPAPMFDVALLRVRAFGGGVAAQMLWGLGINGAFFFVSLYLQHSLGLSPSRSGLMFLAIAGTLVVCAPVAPWLAERFGAARTVGTGLALVAAGLAATASHDPGQGAVGLLPGLFAIGVGSALTVPLTTAVLAAAPTGRAGVAGGLLGTAREASGLLGIAMIGAIVTTGQAAARAEGLDFGAAFAQGYSAGLLTAAVLVAVGAVISAVTLPGRVVSADVGAVPRPVAR